MDKNITSRFAKNASWMIVGRVVQLALTFITALLIPRYLGPTDYGSIQHTYSYIAFLVPLALLGTNEIIVKELLDKKDRNDEVLGTMIAFRLLCGFLSIGLLYIVVNYVSNDPKIIIITILQALTLIFQSFECITYFYQSRLQANITGKITILTYIVTTIFRIVGLIIKRDVKWFAFAVALDHLVLSAFLMYAYFKSGNRLKFSFSLGKELINKSKHYLFASLMIVVYDRANILMLGYFYDDRAVGLFSAATQLCNAWPFVLTAIIDSASPIIIELFKVDKQAFIKRTKQLYASIFYIGLFVAIVFTIFSDLIISIIFGPSYADASVPLKIASWSTIFAYFGVSRAIWMQCNNKLKYEKTIALIGAISNVLLNAILLKPLGIIGAAISLTLTQIITNFITVYIIKDTRENALLIVDAIRLKNVLDNKI